MEKRRIKKFGIHYLVGKNVYGENVWLEFPAWDCNWYWGFGYLHVYENGNLKSHFHVSRFGIDFFFEWNGQGPYIVESPLSDKEKWEFLELFRLFYHFKQHAEMHYIGHSGITNTIVGDALSNVKTWGKTNVETIPLILENVIKLVCPDRFVNEDLKHLQEIVEKAKRDVKKHLQEKEIEDDF